MVSGFYKTFSNRNFIIDFEFFLETPTRWGELAVVRSYLVKVALNVLEHKEVQLLMRSNITYDLVVIEPSYTDALYGFAAHFNASLIGVSSAGSYWNLDTLVGHTASFETLEHTGLRFGLVPLDRFYNWLIISEEWLMNKIYLLPTQRAIHDRFFGHLTQSFTELQQSFSLIMLNQHFSIFSARPNVPGMVEVGGMHVPKQLPNLPDELARFVDEAPEGVIIFALSAEMQSQNLPKPTLDLILSVFEALPQRVVWKFESEPTFNVSSSIYISSWLPQQALLAHPNVRLMVTHGGMLSIIEAAYFAKPILGLPLFYDQFRNVQYMVGHGVGLELDINRMTRQCFETAIRQLVNQSLPYTANALGLSERFRDQLAHPLDVAVYWTEYILRYKGAPHMRVSASNMKLFDYYGLDNLVMVLGRFLLIAGVLYYALLILKRSLQRSYIF